jgi:hypothetical protein
MKCTSRLNRSSFDTMTAALFSRAARGYLRPLALEYSVENSPRRFRRRFKVRRGVRALSDEMELEERWDGCGFFDSAAFGSQWVYGTAVPVCARPRIHVLPSVAPVKRDDHAVAYAMLHL